MSLEHSPARAGNRSAASAPELPEPLDLVWGARQISVVIRKPVRATFHLLESKALPAKKVNGQWVASIRLLRAALEA
jgi:hypothetical protein